MKLKQKKSSTYISGLPWVLPALIFLIIIIYYSIFYTFELSTLDWNGLDPLRKSVGMANFTRMFKDKVFWRCLKNTVVYFAITFVIQNTLGFLFAAILHSQVKLPTVHKCIIFIPYILAPATMAPVFRLMFSPQGMLQSFFDALHLGITVNWLANPNTALYVLMGIAIIMIVLFHVALPRSSAFFGLKRMGNMGVDIFFFLSGAGNLRTLIHMVAPHCKGTTISLAMLGIIGALKTFDIPYLITTGGPNHATEFLGTYIYRQGIRQSHLGYAAALSVTLLVLAVIGALATNHANKGG